MGKQTVIDRIETDPKTGFVSVRFLKQHVDSDGEVTLLGYHRSSVITPDMDVDAHLAEIEADLRNNHKSALDKTHHADIRAHAKIARKPEIVAAFMAEKEKRRKEHEAREAAMAAERAKAQGHTPEVPVPGLGGLPT